MNMNYSDSNNIIDGVNNIIVHTAMDKLLFKEVGDLNDTTLNLTRDVLNELDNMNIIKNPNIELTIEGVDAHIHLCYELNGAQRKFNIVISEE